MHDLDAENAANAAAGRPPDAEPPASPSDPRALASPLGSRRRYYVVCAVHEAEVVHTHRWHLKTMESERASTYPSAR